MMKSDMQLDVHVRELVNILRRRRKLIAVVSLIGATAVMAIPLILGPRYTAKAEIVIDPQRASGGEGGAVMSAMLDPAAIESHVAILLSETQLQQLLSSLAVNKLADTASGELGRKLDFSRISFERLKRGFNAFKERQSRVISITYTASDPAIAAAVVNRGVHLYLSSQVRRNVANRGDTLKSLRDRISQVKTELDRAETAVGAYRSANAYGSTGNADAAEQQIVELNHQLAEVRSELARHEARLASLRDLQHRENGIALVADALDDKELKELSRQQKILRREPGAHMPGTSVGADSASMASLDPVGLRNSIEESISRHMSQVMADRDGAESRARELTNRLASLQEARNKLRSPTIQLQELQREATAFRRLYDDLLQRQKATLEDSEIRVLSFATEPTGPSSVGPLLFALPGLLLAAIGSSLFAVLRERLDTGLRTERDVNDGLGLSCIGLIPRVSKAVRSTNIAITAAMSSTYQDRAVYRESILSTAIAGLKLFDPVDSPRVILVTSCVPDEGKTDFATAFAATATELNRRVLLLDLDFDGRRQLALPAAQATGRANVSGWSSEHLIESISPCSKHGYDQLPLAAILPGPMAILATDHLHDLLQRLKEIYDLVVINAGSLLGSTEARFLGRHADNVLLVIKWESTTREVAQNALELLRRHLYAVSAPIPGELRDDKIAAVITEIDLRRHAEYEHGGLGDTLKYVRKPAAV